MEITLKNRKFRLVACGLCLIAFGIGLVACKQEGKAEISNKTSRLMPCTQLPSCIASLKTPLIRKIIDNNGTDKISLEEMRKYDLNFPDSTNYKNSKQFSVFNSYPSPAEINEILTIVEGSSNSGSLIFTVANRVDDLGTDAPELIAIITNFKEDLCLGVNKNGTDTKIPEVIDAPNILAHPDLPSEGDIRTFPQVLNKNGRSGCFGAQGKYYYYYVLYVF